MVRVKDVEPKPGGSQLDKFKAAARELGTDDDPVRFKERVRKVGSAKPRAPGVAEKR